MDTSPRYSRVVPHPSTNRAQPSLTSEFGRDLVHSRWYGRIRNTLANFRHPCWLMLTFCGVNGQREKSGPCFQSNPSHFRCCRFHCPVPPNPILSLASYFPKVVRNSLECALAIAHVICAKPARWFGELCWSTGVLACCCMKEVQRWGRAC